MSLATGIILCGIGGVGLTIGLRYLNAWQKSQKLPYIHTARRDPFSGYQKMVIYFHPAPGMHTHLRMTCPGFLLMRESDFGHGDFSSELEINCSTLYESDPDSHWTEAVLFKPISSNKINPSPKFEVISR